MAIGSYGTIRPSDVSPEDVEIILNYTPSRDVTSNFVLTQLDAQTILKPYFNNTETGGNAGVEVLGGLYNLTLPAEQFNALGIYTLYLRPAQIRTRITDCGVLNALPNVKGIIIDITNVPTQYQNKFVPQGLVGFRIEYLNADGSKIPNFFRVVTSSFFCEPVVTNETNTTQKSIRYRYVEGNSNLIFLTLSPSSSPTNNPNATPFIGQPNQNIILSNNEIIPFPYKITFAGKKQTTSHLLNWIKNHKDKVKIGRIALEAVEGGYAPGLYFYTRDEKILQLVSLLIGHNFQSVQRIVSTQDLDK